MHIKHHQSSFSDTLLREAEGLQALANQIERSGIKTIRTPKLFEISLTALKMERIGAQRPSAGQMAQLGQGLAELHQVPFQNYGWGTNNYIGLNPQYNQLTDDWGRFFWEFRLLAQVEMIKNASTKARYKTILQNQRLCLVAFLNAHCVHPSLVHGDLWAGNALFDQTHCWLIDPAVYYADREVDIAMTELFGGFGPDFYSAYAKEYPLSSAYPQKRKLYNLYHSLNHYNLFGNAYLQACDQGFEFLENLPFE